MPLPESVKCGGSATSAGRRLDIEAEEMQRYENVWFAPSKLRRKRRAIAFAA